VVSSPAVAEGTVYVGSEDNNLYAIDAATGKEVWHYATGDWIDSSPAISNGVVYVGSNDKNLYAIGTNTVALTTVPTTTRVTDTGTPTSQVTITTAAATTTIPVQQTTQPAPLRYAPIGAVLLVFGIMVRKRH